MKRVFVITLVAFVLAALVGLPRLARVYAADGTLTCGTPPQPAEGSITCEAGAGYVRWSFSGVPRQTYELPLVFTGVTQTVPAKISVNMAYEKERPDPLPYGGASGSSYYIYVIQRYLIRDSATPTFVSDLSVHGPVTSGRVTFPEVIEFYVERLYPGESMNKKLIIERQDLGDKLPAGAPSEKMNGTIELRLLDGPAEEPPHETGSPFRCSFGSRDGHTQAALLSTVGVWHNGVFPGSVQCTPGGNSITWTFNSAPRLALGLAYYFTKSLELQNVNVSWDLTLCGDDLYSGTNNPADSLAQGISSNYGTGYTPWFSVWRIIPGTDCVRSQESGDYTLPASGRPDAWQWAQLKFEGPYMSYKSTRTFPMTGWLTIRAPGWATATPRPTRTPTETLTLTPSPTGTATPGTPSPTATASGGGGGGGGGGDDDPTSPPPPTATFTRTPTSTATSTSTATPTRTPTSTATSSMTSTPLGGGGTGTPVVITATPSFTPVVMTATPSFTPAVYSPTPDWNGTATAIARTQTALAWTPTPVTLTPDWGATATAIARTQTAMVSVSTPNYYHTLTAVSNAPTTQALSGGGGSGLASTPVPTVLSGGWGSNGTSACAAFVRVIVYVDNNKDSLMAVRNEGVQGVNVYLRDADYRIIRRGRTDNGVVKFCVPKALAGEVVYVDIPYLVRSGVVQIPTETQDGGAGVLESVFRIEPPVLPLYIP